MSAWEEALDGCPGMADGRHDYLKKRLGLLIRYPDACVTATGRCAPAVPRCGGSRLIELALAGSLQDACNVANRSPRPAASSPGSATVVSCLLFGSGEAAARVWSPHVSPGSRLRA